MSVYVFVYVRNTYYICMYMYLYVLCIYINYLLQWPPVILSIKNTYSQIARSDSPWHWIFK